MAKYEVYVRQTFSVEADSALQAKDKVMRDEGEYLSRDTEDEVYNITEDRYE